MEKIIILGTGGFAAELTEYIKSNNKYSKKQLEIVGYLDINKKNYFKYGFSAPFLGHEEVYTFKKDEFGIVAVGEENARQKIIAYLLKNNVKVINFIHHSAIVASSSKIGVGNIICPNVIIGPNVIINDFNILNYNCAIAHDSILGKMNIFSPNVQITGYSTIGSNNFFGVSSACTPNINIGNYNKIQAGITVSINVEDGNIIFSMDKIKKMKIYQKEKKWTLKKL